MMMILWGGGGEGRREGEGGREGGRGGEDREREGGREGGGESRVTVEKPEHEH